MKPRKDNRRLRRAKKLTLDQKLALYLRRIEREALIKRRLLVKPKFEVVTVDLDKTYQAMTKQQHKAAERAIYQHWRNCIDKAPETNETSSDSLAHSTP